MKRPSERAQRNLFKLISNTQSMVTDEADWIREGTDLAALGCNDEHGWLNTTLEDAISMISKRLTTVCAQKPKCALSCAFPNLHWDVP